MTGKFLSAKLWLTQAREDLGEFQAREQAALSAKGAYSIFEDLERKPGLKVVGLRLSEIPPTLSTRAANIVGALRSALDQATYRASVLLGASDKSKIYFPLSGCKLNFENMFLPKGKCKIIPLGLHKFLKKTQGFPTSNDYAGGNDLLYAIAMLSNPNKHTDTYRVGIELAQAGHFATQVDVIVEMSLPPVWDRENNEAVLFTTTVTGGGYAKMTIPVYVAFGEIPIVGNQPVIPVLRQMTSIVGGIVDGIEAETTRILGNQPI